MSGYDSKRTVTRWGYVTLPVTMALAAVITYQSGGTSTAAPHLFYLPIVISAFLHGVVGGMAGPLTRWRL